MIAAQTNALTQQKVLQPYYYNRELLAVTDKGQYWVQDFYNTGERYSSAFLVTNPLSLINVDDSSPDDLTTEKVMHVPFVSWYKNGQKRSEVKAIMPNRIAHLQWYRDGATAAQTLYTKQQEVEQQLVWYPNGLIKAQTNYQQGLLHGLQNRWYANGQLKEQLAYSQGKLHGLSLYWYPSGKLREQKTFQLGQLLGAHVQWYESGAILLDNYYESDNARFVRYDRLGNKLQDIVLKDRQFIFNPVFKRQVLMKAADRFLVQDFYLNGYKRTDPYWLTHEVDTLNYKVPQETCRECLSYKVEVEPFSIEGRYVQYYLSGDIAYSLQYKSGQKEGLQVFFDKEKFERIETEFKAGVYDGLSRVWINGIQTYELSYKKGQLDGLAHFWYDNGQLAQEINYKNGKRHGVFKRWDKQGQPQEETYYQAGVRTGLSQTWHANGVQASRVHYQGLIASEGYSQTSHNVQDLIDNLYPQGKVEGVAYAWYPNGALKSLHLYHNGQLLLAQGWYVNRLNQYIQSYHQGKLMFKVSWAADMGDFRVSFFNDNLQLQHAALYKNSRKLLDLDASYLLQLWSESRDLLAIAHYDSSLQKSYWGFYFKMF